MTQIFVQDGVLIPRYYNVYRKEPDSDIYWRYSPFYCTEAVKSLRRVYGKELILRILTAGHL